jgi:hypothetical protein
MLGNGSAGLTDRTPRRRELPAVAARNRRVIIVDAVYALPVDAVYALPVNVFSPPMPMSLAFW